MGQIKIWLVQYIVERASDHKYTITACLPGEGEI